jgi:hypothetical protein
MAVFALRHPKILRGSHIPKVTFYFHPITAGFIPVTPAQADGFCFLALAA